MNLNRTLDTVMETDQEADLIIKWPDTIRVIGLFWSGDLIWNIVPRPGHYIRSVHCRSSVEQSSCPSHAVSTGRRHGR